MRRGDSNHINSEEIKINKDEEDNYGFNLIEDEIKNERDRNKNIFEFNKLKEIIESKGYDNINNSVVKKNSFMLLRDTLENLGKQNDS